MQKSVWKVACLVCVALLVACDSEPKRGGAGESCTAANDCNDGLACIKLTCVDASSRADAVAETDAAVASDDGDDGSSCAARRDCPEGSMCVANSCQPIANGVSTSTRYSGRGESCQAKNDCEPDLVCMMGLCREAGLTLPHLDKACYRVECGTKDDCCAAFVPNPNCETYKQNCATDPIFCNTYRSLCECAQDCVDELCTATEPGCESDKECTSSQTPFCVEKKCRQCNKDSDCPGDSSKCAQGTCMAPCASDSNCPLLYACQDNACVQTGCTTDRECAFITNSARAVCKDKKCQAPCEVDSDCTVGDKSTVATNFQVCESGECKFVGCENDTECRALFNVAGVPGKVHAVCR